MVVLVVVSRSGPRAHVVEPDAVRTVPVSAPGKGPAPVEEFAPRARVAPAPRPAPVAAAPGGAQEPEQDEGAAPVHRVPTRVEFPDGEPVATAVFFGSRAGRPLEVDFEPTDTAGHYDLLLAAGSWHLTASAGDGERWMAPLERFESPVSVPHRGPPLLFVLRPTARLQGVVLDAAGAPADDTSVFVGIPGKIETSERTGEDGAFDFERLPAGRLELRAASKELKVSRELDLAPGETRFVDLRLPAGGWITVEVTDEHGGTLEANVALIAGTEQVSGGHDTGQPIGPLAAGVYQVVSLFDDTASGEILRSAEAVVVAGETTHVVLGPTEVGATIVGTVTANGMPVNDEALFAFTEGRPLLHGVEILRLDDAGNYRLELEEPAGVLFGVGGDAGPRIVSHVPAGWSGTLRHDIAVSSAALSGRIVGERGEGDWRAWLRPERRAVDVSIPDESRGRRVSDAGDFTFQSVNPGRFEVWGFSDEGLLAGPLSVSLRDGEERTGVVLEARPGAWLAGSVVRETPTGAGPPAPPEEFVVHLRSRSGRPLPQRVENQDGGVFRARSLPPGPVLVTALTETEVATAEVDLKAGQENGVRLVLGSGRLVTARAVSGGRPVTAKITCHGPWGEDTSALLSPSRFGESFVAPVSTSERTFGPLPPGTYEVRAEAPDGRSARRTVRLGAERGEVVELKL